VSATEGRALSVTAPATRKPTSRRWRSRSATTSASLGPASTSWWQPWPRCRCRPKARRRSGDVRSGRRRRAPYRPQTNGKAERFIRTLLEVWAYAYSYPHERDRALALAQALDSYNRFRRHRALGGLAPSSASTTSLGRTT